MVTAWRVVNSLRVLRDQLDDAFPGRSHASDGTICDSNHDPSSDHCPHNYPQLGDSVVTAFDGTQDPAHGCDNTVITEAIRVSRDARVKYCIWKHRMFSSYVSSSGIPAWTWRPYTGTSDPHTNHFHISTVPTAIADSTALWSIGVDMPLTPADLQQVGLTVWTWDLINGPNVGQAYVLINQLVADVAELKARPPVEAAPVDAVTLAAALQDPAVIEVLRQAAFEGSQRAEGE